MSVSQEFLDKSIEFDHSIEKFKNFLWLYNLKNYIKFRQEVLKLVRSSYGRALTVASKAQLIKEFKGLKNKYIGRINQFVASQLESFHKQYSGLLYKGTKEVFKRYDRPEKVQRASLETQLFTKQHPTTENGRMISVAGLFKIWDFNINNEVGMAIEQARVLKQSTEDLGRNVSRFLNKEQMNLRTTIFSVVALVQGLTKKRFYDINRQVISGYQWVSVMDAVTSEGCQERHMKVWYYDMPEKSTLAYEEYPPRHLNCRSDTSPLFVFDDGTLVIGNYDTWLRRQEPSTQRRILGSDYDTYVQDKGPIKAFMVSDRSTLSLEQLGAAFDKIFM